MVWSRSIGPHPGIASRSGLEKLPPGLATDLGKLARGHLAAGVRFEPGPPVRPPRSLVLFGRGEPIRGFRRKLLVGPVAILVRRGRIDHARDVTRAGEHEARLSAEQTCARVSRFPRRDVV